MSDLDDAIRTAIERYGEDAVRDALDVAALLEDLKPESLAAVRAARAANEDGTEGALFFRWTGAESSVTAVFVTQPIVVNFPHERAG